MYIYICPLVRIKKQLVRFVLLDQHPTRIKTRNQASAQARGDSHGATDKDEHAANVLSNAPMVCLRVSCRCGENYTDYQMCRFMFGGVCRAAMAGGMC